MIATTANLQIEARPQGSGHQFPTTCGKIAHLARKNVLEAKEEFSQDTVSRNNTPWRD
jgi:hypothetical protein